jgi:tRNA-dihydrouridine synthase B
VGPARRHRSRFARAAEQVGVQAVTVHARFASQGFTGTADWDIIGEVKAAVSAIPVVGNGDIETPQDARRMIERTGCDAVMVGRAGDGQPVAARRITLYLQTGVVAPEPTLEERVAVAREHARLQVAQMGESIGSASCADCSATTSKAFRAPRASGKR